MRDVDAAGNSPTLTNETVKQTTRRAGALLHAGQLFRDQRLIDVSGPKAATTTGTGWRKKEKRRRAGEET